MYDLRIKLDNRTAVHCTYLCCEYTFSRGVAYTLPLICFVYNFPCIVCIYSFHHIGSINVRDDLRGEGIFEGEECLIDGGIF